MRLLFLDIDGVLNTTDHLLGAPTEIIEDDIVDESVRTSLSYLSRPHIEVLNKLIDQTGASVVVSSSWRHAYSAAQLLDLLRRRGYCHEVIGATPCILCASRGQEIAAYLRSLGEPASFVILDDINDVGDLEKHLIHTDPEVGLCEEHIQLALELFASQESADV